MAKLCSARRGRLGIMYRTYTIIRVKTMSSSGLEIGVYKGVYKLLIVITFGLYRTIHIILV